MHITSSGTAVPGSGRGRARPMVYRLLAAGASAVALASLVAGYPSRASAAATGCLGGQPPPPGAVSCRPADGTPHLPASTPHTWTIRQLVQCGSMMYAVGKFGSVTGYDARSGSMATFRRNNAFSFSATPPFAVSAWDPSTDGKVNSVAVGGGHCATAYLGGGFRSVHGTPARDIAAVTTTTGAVRTGFAHHANGQVETVLLAARRLLVGGFFTAINGSGRNYYAALDPATGRDTGYLRLRVHGHYSYPGVTPNSTRIYNQQLSHSGHRLLVEGDFTSAGGKHRQQIFMLGLDARQGRVTSWRSREFNRYCSTAWPFYIRGASWSPDGNTVYIATTGMYPAGGSATGKRTGLCDVAAAFPARLARVRHLWRNYTGCDSLYSTAASPGTVYFAGHERWANNRHGCNKAGPGAIAAPGMVGLSPSGAVTYDPTRSRGRGADSMLLTQSGLWIASDNFHGSDKCGHITGHAGICFLPYRAG
jgi:hypothetical protein